MNGESLFDTHFRSMPTEKPFSPDPEKTTARIDGSVERLSKTVRISRQALRHLSLFSLDLIHICGLLFQEGVDMAWPINLDVSDPWLWYSDFEIFIILIRHVDIGANELILLGVRGCYRRQCDDLDSLFINISDLAKQANQNAFPQLGVSNESRLRAFRLI